MKAEEGDPLPPAPPGERARSRHEPGLCPRCRSVRRIENARGSVFLLCERSREDPRFPRYPAQPVLDCTGFES